MENQIVNPYGVPEHDKPDGNPVEQGQTILTSDDPLKIEQREDPKSAKGSDSKRGTAFASCDQIGQVRRKNPLGTVMSLSRQRSY